MPLLPLLLVLAACASAPVASPPDDVPDAGGPDAGEPDAGELTIVQAYLPMGLVPRLGEAGAIVGPDGTLVLVDVGSSAHDDDVRALVRELNARRGRPPLEVEWIVITHLHGDHGGGLADLLGGDEPVRVTRGIVHRGFVDLGEGTDEGTFEDACDLLSASPLGRPLCASARSAPCDASDAQAGRFPAIACDGLFAGDLADPGDDARGEPSFVALGGGARITFVAADGFVSDGRASVATPIGYATTNEENARSLVAIVSHGAFRSTFGGDLTGSGEEGVPDVETLVATRAFASFLGPLGADVVHAHHHARKTSSNRALVDALAPADGRARNVIAGVNAAYLGSPAQPVLDAWGPRLGEGAFWVTNTAAGAGEHAKLVEVEGAIEVTTTGGGRGYVVGGRAFGSVRAP